MSFLEGHTRVKSSLGPEFCCKECSLEKKEYVEWPCPEAFLRICLVVGSSQPSGIDREEENNGS